MVFVLHNCYCRLSEKCALEDYFCLMNNRQLFQLHLAQTSPAPIGLHIVKAEGNYLHDAEGNKYLDLIGGISVCNIGHSHPEVIAAVKKQADEYLHVIGIW